MQSIILASQSPRRKQLLEWAEVPFEVHVSGTDESYPPGLQPVGVAEHIALEKAKGVASHHFGKVILAADTIVVLDGEVIGKPSDRDDAIRILKKLSNRTHEVITGVAILHKSDGKENCIVFSDVTRVSFHQLDDAQIRFYVDKYEPFDKAGAYAIQEWVGVVGIQRIEGDFYNVMGLPVSRVVQELRKFSWQKDVSIEGDSGR